MSDKTKYYIRKFVRYMYRTYKNKLCALALVLIGWLSTLIDNEGTAFVLCLMIAVPLFFTRNNWIVKIEKESRN